MTNQQVMEAAAGSDLNELQDRLEALNKVLAESQAATVAAHAAVRDSDAQTIEIAAWTKQISQTLRELEERSFAEIRGMGPSACAIEDLAISVSRKQAALQLLNAEAQDRAEDVRPALVIKDLTAEAAEAHAMGKRADQCRLVSAKKLLLALANVPESEGQINIVTEAQESLERYAAACSEKHSLAIQALDREVQRQAKNREHRLGIITRQNVSSTF